MLKERPVYLYLHRQPEVSRQIEASQQSEASQRMKASQQPEASQRMKASQQPEASQRMKASQQLESFHPKEALQPPPAAGKFGGRTTDLLLAALEDYGKRTGIGPNSNAVSVMRTALGRPYFIGSDGAFCSTQCSVSHSGRFWICALSECRLGIDLEDPEYGRTHDEKRVARRFFSPREMEYVEEGGREAFYRLWVRKEALLKYRGTGLTELESCSVLESCCLWIENFTLQAGVFAAVCGAVPLKWKEMIEL